MRASPRRLQPARERGDQVSRAHFHGIQPDYLDNTPLWPPVDQAGPPRPPGPTTRAPACRRGWSATSRCCPSTTWRRPSRAIGDHGDEVAAVILEPINYDAGGIKPLPGFLEGLRRLTAERGIVLIFDEILSGFRPAAVRLTGVTPEPLHDRQGRSAAARRSAPSAAGAEIMGVVSPLGPAVHSGDLQRPPNPIPGRPRLPDGARAPRLLPAAAGAGRPALPQPGRPLPARGRAGPRPGRRLPLRPFFFGPASRGR